MPTKARTLAKGSLLRILNFFLNAIVAFVMMPFVIHSLGDKMYGLWIFIGSFLDFYGLFDLGFSSAVQRYVSRAIGSEDYKEANIVINTSLFLFLLIGAVAFLFSCVAAFMVPFFVENITEVILFRQIIVILGFSFALSFPMKVFSGILTSHLRYDLVTTTSIINLIFRAILVFIFLKLGYGVIALALITLCTDVLFYFINYLLSRRVSRFIKFSKEFVVIARIRMLFHYGIFAFINQIANKLRFGIDNFVITAFMGLNFVTMYSIASRLIQYFIAFIETTLGVMAPVFSQYEGRNDYESIKEKLVLTTKISSYLSIMVGGILILFGRAFIQRWMGVEYIESYPVLLILAISVIFACMQAPSVQVLYGISKHKLFAITNSIEGVANLILSIILVRKYGLVGVALGTAIPMIIIKLFVQPLYICKVIKIEIKKYYLKILLPTMLNSYAVLVVIWLILRNLISADYFKLVTLILGLVVLFSGCILFLGFDILERNYFKKLIFARKF